MKCKVCGYEFDSNREYCPMCGSKIPAETRRKEEEEMSWNTYDFPKPKKLEDIEMHWPSLNPRADGAVSAMKQDATEGFIRTPVRETPKPETPMPDPWASVQQDFPKAAQPVPEAPSFTVPAPQAAPPQPEPAPAPQPAGPQVQTPQPQQTFQTPPFTQGAWQMPQMQPEPTWTPYGVQTPPQPQVQIPPISPAYAPTTFTQQYGAQYSQAQYTQPQTAWTIPPQPQPGQQVYVTQPAQPVYIQPQPPVVPVYQAVTPPYPQQPAPAPAPAPAPVQPAPAPAPVPEPAPVAQPEPAPAPAPAPAPVEEPKVEIKEEPKEEPKAEPKERILEEHIVATTEEPSEEIPKCESPLETSIFAETQTDLEPDENGRLPERFFTFNKKNEEFQQLLNQEYERLRNLHGGDLDDLSRTSIYRKDTFQPTPAQDFFHNNDISTDLSEFEKMLMESTKDAEGDETLAINRDRIKGAALSAEELIDPLPTKAGDTHPLGEAPAPAPAAEPEPEPVPQTPEEAAKSEHRKRMEAMAKAREAYFASLRTMTAEMKAVKDAEFKAQLEKEARISHEPFVREAVPEKTAEQIAAEKAEEAKKAAEREAAERAAAIEQAKAEMKAAQEAQEKELGLDALDEVVSRQPETAEEPEEKPEKTPVESPAEEPKGDTKEIPVKAQPERDKTEVLGEILDDVEEETEKKEKREHSHWFLKFLLALLIVAGAAEGGTIALRHYAPDSPASIITTGIEQNVIQFVQSSFDQIKAKFQKDEPEETVPEGEPQGEEGPAFVLSDLIAENNKNIEEVVENLAIGYDSQRSYDVPGLAAAQLVTDTAEKTAVCKTLIGYNSAWIDFINGTSQDCLNFLKADGTAYRSAVTFDKIGQITEVFKKLEIGEIRKTEGAYFAFAGETIEVTQDEATAQSSGFMVYELVPVGEELKIKDYYNITN